MSTDGNAVMRIHDHPILDLPEWGRQVAIQVDGRPMSAFEGEPIAAALIAAGIRVFRYTARTGEPRGVFCALGRCTDCRMTVNGVPNVRTCVTPVEEGMIIQTQRGLGTWEAPDEGS